MGREQRQAEAHVQPLTQRGDNLGVTWLPEVVEQDPATMHNIVTNF